MTQDTRLPKVSVVVPTFNHGHWLAECLDSIVAQVAEFNFEILVGDDASTDRISRDILDRYGSRYPELITVYKNEKNLGPGTNFLNLITHARGEYIAHCDGDDLMLPGKLQRQADFLDSHPGFSMVVHPMYKQTGSKRVQAPCGMNQMMTVNELLLNTHPFYSSSKMFRRGLIQKSYNIDFIVDFFLHVEIALNGPVGVIDDYLGVYRSGVGISFQKKFKLALADAGLAVYDYALKRGCDPLVVKKGYLLMRFNRAIDLLYSRMYADFFRLANIAPEDVGFLSGRNKMIWLLRRHPIVCRFLFWLRLPWILRSLLRLFLFQKKHCKIPGWDD